ncbi:MAG: universal stress protein [Pseudomonadota bacterium]
MYEHILICLDLRYRESELLLRRGAALVAAGGRVSVLSVVEVGTFDAAREAVASLIEEEYHARSAHLARLCAAAGLSDADLRVVAGQAASEIARFAREAGVDLVVMGEHGERSDHRRLGSTADTALRQLECDALVVRGPAAAGPG